MAADDAFGEAFSNVAAIDNIVEVTDSTKRRRRVNHGDDSEETVRLGMELFPVGHEEDDGYDNDQSGRSSCER